MTKRELAELEQMQRLVDAGAAQLRETFDMYMTLLQMVDTRQSVKAMQQVVENGNQQVKAASDMYLKFKELSDGS